MIDCGSKMDTSRSNRYPPHAPSRLGPYKSQPWSSDGDSLWKEQRMVIKTPYMLKTTLRTFEFSFYSYRNAKVWLKTSVEGAGITDWAAAAGIWQQAPFVWWYYKFPPIRRTRGNSISQMPSTLESRYQVFYTPTGCLRRLLWHHRF